MTEIAKIIGEESVEVLKRDGSPVVVKVSALPLSKMDKWLVAQDDESEMIQLATGLNAEQVDELAPESQERLLKFAEEMNASFFERFVARRLQRAQRLESYKAGAKSSPE